MQKRMQPLLESTPPWLPSIRGSLFSQRLRLPSIRGFLISQRLRATAADPLQKDPTIAGSYFHGIPFRDPLHAPTLRTSRDARAIESTDTPTVHQTRSGKRTRRPVLRSRIHATYTEYMPKCPSAGQQFSERNAAWKIAQEGGRESTVTPTVHQTRSGKRTRCPVLRSRMHATYTA